MKSYLPLLTFAVLLTSCSSVYKSGQTPDDVYFSPARPQEDEYVRMEKKNDRMYRNQNYDYTLEDQYLRMKTRNRRYAFLEDDLDCYCYGSNYSSYYNYYRLNNYYGGYYNPSLWSLNYGFSNYYSPYYYNPYYYNPYYGNPYYSGVVYGNVSPVYNKPRTSNLNIFNGNPYNPEMPKSNGRVFSTSSGSDGNYRGSGTNAGGFLRNVFGSGNNSTSNPSSTQPSSSNPGSNSGSSSSSGGGHAPVRKF